MSSTTLKQLLDHGQSVWYDNIQRAMLQSGELQRLVDDGVRGVTSNPTIFKNAISQGQEYLADITALSRQGKSALRNLSRRSPSPTSARRRMSCARSTTTAMAWMATSASRSIRCWRTTRGTIAEARRLFATLDRPNIMIKVPARRRASRPSAP